MNIKALVIKTEGNLVWLAAEPESCCICPSDGAQGHSCGACEKRALPPFTARNSRGLDLKPGMKVLSAFPQGRALAQGAASFGIPLAAALLGYFLAPQSPLAAKPVAALAGLAAAALAVCGVSSFIRKKFPRAYGEMEVTEILDEPSAICFPGGLGNKGGGSSQSPLHSG